jgi:hypothetical protein
MTGTPKAVGLHRRLQCADRIDLSDDDAATLTTQRASAQPLPTSPKPNTTAALPPSMTSVARFRPSMTE